MSTLFRVFLLSLLLLPATPAARAGDALSIGPIGVLFHDVELRPGVEADIHVTVIGDLDSDDCQVTIHGGPYTAETWRPYAEALGTEACVLAIDLPGHGQSSVPTGIVFGELLLDDYVTTVIAVLDALDTHFDIEPTTLVGHSLGGTVVQMIQQRLVDDGSHLEERFDISEAILVASDYPQEVPWAFVDSGAAGPVIGAFIVQDPVLGSIMQISADVWPAFFFTNLAGEVVAGAPTPQEIVDLGYVAPGEPEGVIAQLLGLPPFAARPSVDAAIFDDDTRLRVVAYDNDGFILLDESQGLYTHLTGDESLDCFVPVLGPDKTHATQITNPQSLVQALAAADDCEYEEDDD
ncbi:MAG: alpha/beta fold hydrolase [Holophagales bacterium]|nr:alpha/beta fold hydrolase [Holophagales bacterium]